MRFVEQGRTVVRKFRNSIGQMRLKTFGPITHVATNLRLAALTFDDGPHPKYTRQLIEILDRHNAKATFFMVGKAAAQYPEVVKMVAEAGHVIGNHTWDHPVFGEVSTHERLRQIRYCSRTLRPFETKLFRPPYGVENYRSHFCARLMGYQVVKWNIAVVDWENYSADWIADNVVSQLRPGSIILMHDNLYGADDPCRESTLEAVDRILRNASKEFRFGSIPDLFSSGRPERSRQAIGRTASIL